MSDFLLYYFIKNKNHFFYIFFIMFCHFKCTLSGPVSDDERREDNQCLRDDLVHTPDKFKSEFNNRLWTVTGTKNMRIHAARLLAIIENYTGTAEKMDQDLLAKIKNGKENEDNCIMLYDHEEYTYKKKYLNNELYIVKKTAKKKDIP